MHQIAYNMAQLHNEGAFSHNKDPELKMHNVFLKMFWQSLYVYNIGAIAFGWIHFNKKQVFYFILSKRDVEMTPYYIYFLKFCYILNWAHYSM